MKGALIILAVTIITGIILYLLDRKYRKPIITNGDKLYENSDETDSSNTPTPQEEGADSGSGECCGLHLVCDKELTALSEDRILYYDDEELDRFIGREPEEYNAEETEEFRDVLMTLLPQDVPGWARSLDKRNIRPPQEIRDELLIMLRDLM